MYLISKVVAVVDVIKISPVQTFYETFLRLTPFSFNVREQSKSFSCSGAFVWREVMFHYLFFIWHFIKIFPYLIETNMNLFCSLLLHYLGKI